MSPFYKAIPHIRPYFTCYRDSKILLNLHPTRETTHLISLPFHHRRGGIVRWGYSIIPEQFFFTFNLLYRYNNFQLFSICFVDNIIYITNNNNNLHTKDRTDLDTRTNTHHFCYYYNVLCHCGTTLYISIIYAFEIRLSLLNAN